MTAIVFAGPTIRAQDVKDAGFKCLPPAAQGDIYRAALRKPPAIGIIDGYFQGVPAIWHKEILWAMDQGVHVFGSSSMGALRAAELWQFGMRGIGKIFQDYRDGHLEDDDEVALQHGPAELGFIPVSEPMVDVRAMLDLAVSGGIISSEHASELCQIAKSIFYQDRTWKRVFEQSDLSGRQRSELETWLQDCKFSQKRADAEDLLVAMQSFLSTNPEPMVTDYVFEWTHLWDEVITQSQGLVQDAEKLIIDELRLVPERYQAVRRAALLRGLAMSEAARTGNTPTQKDLMSAAKKFREDRNLFRHDALLAWLTESEMEEDQFQALMNEEAQLSLVNAAHNFHLDSYMISEIRASGEYNELSERAQEKSAALPQNMSSGIDDASGPDQSPMVLAMWYFETRLGRRAPDDLRACIDFFGLEDSNQLQRLLLREYRFCADERAPA